MKLTPEQERAVAAANQDLVLIAGAGSGKTLMLSEIACHLIRECRVPPHQLVVITFTEKAANELKERILSRLDQAPDFLDDCPIGTIHFFASYLLRRGATDFPPHFVIWDEYRSSIEQSRIVQETLSLGLQEKRSELISLLDEFGWRRVCHLLSEQLQARWKMSRCPKKNDHDLLWQAYSQVYEQVANRYREHKRRYGALDFEDLEEEALRWLGQKDNRDKVQRQFSHILVDEYQDTSWLQHQLIQQVHQTGVNRLIVVGDPYQSIYRFRGAEMSLFEEACQTLSRSGGQAIELKTNFRSTLPLINVFNGVFTQIFGEGYRPMSGLDEGHGPPLKVLDLPSLRGLNERRAVEAEQVAQHIGGAISQGVRVDDFAILFRSRAAMPLYEAALKEKGIPYITSGGYPLLERQEIIDQMNLLQVLCRPDDTLALVGLLRSPLAGITDEMLWALRDRDFRACLSGKREAEVFTGEEKEIWCDFSQWWQEMLLQAGHLKASEIAHRVFLRRVQKSSMKAQARSNTLQWIALLEHMEEIDPLGLPELLEMIQSLKEDEARIMEWIPREEGQESVLLMTVHSAKGLEFPRVVLADLSASIPTRSDLILFDTDQGAALKRRDPDAVGLRDSLIEDDHYQQVKKVIREKDLAEAKRLLYVACTRAKESLILPLDKNRKKKGATWNDWLCEALNE